MQAEPPEYVDLEISHLKVRGPEGLGKSYGTDITDLDDLLVCGGVKLLNKIWSRLIKRHGFGQLQKLTCVKSRRE